MCHLLQKPLLLNMLMVALYTHRFLPPHFLETNEFLFLIDRQSVVNDLNPSKHPTVNFSLRNEQPSNTLLVPHRVCTTVDSVIKTVSKFIYLGVSFSFDHSWSFHVLLLSKKVFRLTYIKIWYMLLALLNIYDL